MQKSVFFQQSPNFNNNNIQMYSNQFPIKQNHQQQLQSIMDSANNSATYNKIGNQQMPGIFAGTGQFSMSGGSTGGSNNSCFQPLTSQSNQVFY